MVVSGALVIAGIGFAGSYAAVRELALKKGFGTFAYIFPIGIDAGICVLLALDLLLTRIRIPFPLLRQTAWLLTAATIAFNAAAATDPLGAGMHAVIPILFVVTVEAARHAIGRIADITADTHMDGIRPTRWLLSPLPTFLLWRRMKLWELRSYEQAITREQERLVYQTRLRTRYGRAWRRKAPVESITPLRLTRYGIPLAETAPSGLAAAGIEPVLLPPEPQSEPAHEPEQPTAPTPQSEPAREPEPAAPALESADTAASSHTPQAAPALQNDTSPAGEQHPDPDDNKPPEQPEHVPYPGPEDEDNTPPQQPQHIRQPGPDTRSRPDDRLHEPAHPDGHPPGYDLKQHAPGHHKQEVQDPAAGPASQHTREHKEHELNEPPAPHTTPDETASSSHPPARTAGEALHPARSTDTVPPPRNAQTPPAGQEPEPDAPVPPAGLTHAHSTPGKTTPPPRSSLTPVDRYYLAWHNLHQQLHTEPDAAELSAYLARRGILDRDNQPIRPKTLARYYLQFRIYTIWAHHRTLNNPPDPNHVTKDLTQHGITAQYNKPIHPHDLNRHHHTFEHRWQALHHHTPNNPPPHNTSH